MSMTDIERRWEERKEKIEKLRDRAFNKKELESLHDDELNELFNSEFENK